MCAKLLFGSIMSSADWSNVHFGFQNTPALVCQVSAYRRVKSRLGVGKEDKFSYGHSVGPTGVISVNVPNYQHHAQRQQAFQQAQMGGQPVPQLPTPFAAAQVPLPDDGDVEGAGGHMPPSRAGSNPFTDHAKTAAGGAAAKRTSSHLQRQSLVPGRASAAPVTTRLGSAPPGIKRPSAMGNRLGSSPHHKSAPGLGNPPSLTLSFCSYCPCLTNRGCPVSVWQRGMRNRAGVCIV